MKNNNIVLLRDWQEMKQERVDINGRMPYNEDGNYPELRGIESHTEEAAMSNEEYFNKYIDGRFERIEATTNDIKDENKGIRAETREEISGVHTEIKSLRAEVKQEIGGLRTELKQDIGELRTDISKLPYWFITTILSIAALCAGLIYFVHTSNQQFMSVLVGALK